MVSQVIPPIQIFSHNSVHISLFFFKPIYKFGSFVHCQRVWTGEDSTNYRGPAIRNGTQGPNMLHKFLSFTVVSVLANCNPYRPSPRHTANESQSFRYNVQIFGQSAYAGAGGNFFCTGTRTRCRWSFVRCMIVHELPA